MHRALASCLLLCACVTPVDVGTHDGGAPACLGRTLVSSSPTSKPNLFLVVDSSGSLAFSDDPREACRQCPSADCTANQCVTRERELKSALSDFLSAHGADAHFGLLPFPAGGGDAACTATTLSDIAVRGTELDTTIPDDNLVALAGKATQVDSQIQRLVPLGGTPTAATLNALRNYPPLVLTGRASFVVLVTDGVPDCNPALDAFSCQCTVPVQPGQSCTNRGLNLCVDREQTVATIQRLRANGVRTIVVALGTDANAEPTLSAMALAGDAPRRCVVDGDCGDSACDQSGICGRPFFSAGTGGQLSLALSQITAARSSSAMACIRTVGAVSNPDRLGVYVGPQRASRDDWSYRDGELSFFGDACVALKAGATAQICD